MTSLKDKGAICKRCADFYVKHPLVKDEVLGGERHKDSHYGSPVECAFPNGVFNTNNWGCFTMGELRDFFYTEEGEKHYWRDDMKNASLGVIPIPEECDLSGYVVMSWYKDRGRTGQAWVFNDEEPPHPITLKETEAIIEALQPKLSKKIKEVKALIREARIDELEELIAVWNDVLFNRRTPDIAKPAIKRIKADVEKRLREIRNE